MNSNHYSLFKQTAALTVAAAFVAFSGFAMLEPATTEAQSDSTTFDVTLSVNSEITITDPGNVSMGSISLTNDEVTGGNTVTVETNNQSGYTLDIAASTDPAMQHDSQSESFADYTPSGGTTVNGNEYDSFSVDSSSYEFAFSAYGSHVPSGIDSSGTDNCSDTSTDSYGAPTTTATTIASNGSETQDGGTNTTVCFAAAQNGVNAPSGSYTATITLTASTS